MKKLSTKIISMVVFVALVSCLGLGIISYIIASTSTKKIIYEELQMLATQGAENVVSSLDGQWDTLEALASNEKIANPDVSFNEKTQILQDYKQKVGAVDLNYTDKNGTATTIAGASINVSEREYFKKAISGERAVSNPVEDKSNPGNMIVVYAIPLYWQGNIVGILMQINDGSYLSDITDKVTFGDTGNAMIINKELTTIASNNREAVLSMYNTKKELEKDTSLQDLVTVQEKAVQGTVGYGEYQYNSKKNTIGYAPIEGTNWTFIVSAENSDVFGVQTKIISQLIIFTTICLVIVSAIGFFIGKRISKPITIIAEKLEDASTGNFTNEVPAYLLQVKDETGKLANALTTMQNSVKTLISSVKCESQSVGNNVDAQEKQLTHLLEELENISATTEQLSASMQETAASTEEMYASSELISETLDAISARSKQGFQTTSEISNRAKELKKVAVKSKESALSIYKETEITLKDAVEKSKNVNKIKALSDAILEIASETNLLSLNASIEAARAGESGRGFAVVANQIGKLAEDSQKSVTQIQNVTDYVLESVENLSNCSMQLLEFMDQRVLRDYEMLVNTSEQYNEDANLVEDIISDFANTVEQLNGTINEIGNAIKEIATATNEGSGGTSQIAEMATVIVNNTNEVLTSAKESKDSSSHLIESIEKFIV